MKNADKNALQVEGELVKNIPTVPAPRIEDVHEAALAIFNQKTDLSTLPPELQEALKDYDVAELVGIAPTWKPSTIGEAILGECQSARTGVGPHKSAVMTLATPKGHLSIWLGADLLTKMGVDPQSTDISRLQGKVFCIQNFGWLKKDAPGSPKSLKNDMRLFKAFEIRGPKVARASR